MKKLFTIIIITFVFTSCKTKTVYVPVKQTSVETVFIRDTVVQMKLKYYRDTISTPDTISFLSNPYCFSWAELRDGKLNHSLTSWPDSLIPIQVKYIERLRVDSIPAPYPVEVIKYTEKELNWWQLIRIRIGEISIVLLLGVLIWFLSKKKG